MSVDSDPTFFGSVSVSPTTEDLERYSKLKRNRWPGPQSTVLKVRNEEEKQGSAKKAVVNINKSVIFTIENIKQGKPQPSKKVIAKRICYTILGVLVLIALLSILVYAFLIPLVIFLNPEFRRQLMFVGWQRSSPSELETPSALGFRCSTNLLIKTQYGAIGSWYTPPAASQPCGEVQPYAALTPTVLFVPTFGETRAATRRLALHKIISEDLGYHVLAFDYRGIADSDEVLPSVQTVVEDSVSMYNYLKGQVTNANNSAGIIIWGDTWGGAVALQLLTDIAFQKSADLKMLVLQTPVESTAKAAQNALEFNRFWRWLPFFERVFVEPLQSDSNTNFDSLRVIVKRKPLSTLILHPADDAVVEVDQGTAIYMALTDIRNTLNSSARIAMNNFTEQGNLGHNIESNPTAVAKMVRQFMTFEDRLDSNSHSISD